MVHNTGTYFYVSKEPSIYPAGKRRKLLLILSASLVLPPSDEVQNYADKEGIF
jgi:hypothetical protein